MKQKGGEGKEEGGGEEEEEQETEMDKLRVELARVVEEKNTAKKKAKEDAEKLKLELAKVVKERNSMEETLKLSSQGAGGEKKEGSSGGDIKSGLSDVQANDTIAQMMAGMGSLRN